MTELIERVARIETEPPVDPMLTRTDDGSKLLVFSYKDKNRPTAAEIAEKQALGFPMTEWELRILWSDETKCELYHARNEKLCVWCGKELEFDDATLDHVIPRAHGGRDHIDNCAIACRKCNNVRGTLTPGQFLSSPYYRRLKAIRIAEEASRMPNALNFQTVYIKSSMMV